MSEDPIKIPKPSDVLGNNKIPSPSDILGDTEKKKSTSIIASQKSDSVMNVGSLGGVKQIDKNFKLFPNDVVKTTSSKTVLPKINKNLQEAINKPENIAKQKEFQRQEIAKWREYTKLNEEEKKESEVELQAKKKQEGLWNNIKSIGSDVVNKASEFVFNMTDEGTTPEDLILEKDPLYKEKQQAKISLREQGIKNPNADEVGRLADKIYLDNANLEKKQQKINSYLNGVDPTTKSALKIDAEDRFKTLSKSKKELTNRISLNEKYFQELLDDLENPNIPDENKKKSGEELIKVKGYLENDYETFSKKSDELGTAQDEFDAFKRNYSALDNVMSRASLSLANAGVSLYSGANYLANTFGAGEEYKQENIQKAKQFLEDKKNEFRPENKDITLNNFFQYSTDLLANQTGTLAQIGAGGLGGVVSLGIEGSGDKYSEMIQGNKSGKNYSPTQMALAPLISGLSEAVFAELPTIKTLKNSANVWKSALKESAGKEMIGEAIKNTSESIAKNILKDTKKEVSTELINNIVQNSIKKDIQNDNTVGYFDNSINVLKDTALLTGMIGSVGAMPHVAISAVKTFSNKSESKQLDLNGKKINELLSSLDDKNISETTKKVIEEQIKLATKQSSEIINKTIDKMGKMPLNQLEIIYNNSKRISELQNEAIEIKDNTYLNDNSKTILLNGLKEEYKNIEETNTGIISGAISPVESLPIKEQDKIKREASQELIKELNPDGNKNIKIDNEQITERANQIYLKQQKDAETESTVTEVKPEAKPQAEVPQQAEAEKVVEQAVINNDEIATKNNNKVNDVNALSNGSNQEVSPVEDEVASSVEKAQPQAEEQKAEQEVLGPNYNQIKKGLYSQEEIERNNDFYDNEFNEISDEIEKKLKEKGEYSFEKLSQELQKDKRIVENDKKRNELSSHNNKIIKDLLFNAIESIDLKGRFYVNNLKDFIQEKLKTTLIKRFLLNNEDVNISEKLIGSFNGSQLEGIKQDFVNAFLPPGTRFNDLTSDQKSEALEKTKDLFDKFIKDVSESIVKNTNNEATPPTNTPSNEDFRLRDNADLQQSKVENLQSSSNIGEGKSSIEYAKEQINNGILEWNGDINSPRIDLDMSWADIRKGQADLAKGKENTVPAKRLIEAINNAKELGGYNYKYGTGGENMRAKEFVSFEDLQKTKNEYQLNDAELKEVKDNELENAKKYDEYFNKLSKEEQIDILDDYENRGNTNTGEVSENVNGGEIKENISNEQTKSEREQVNYKYNKDSFEVFASKVPNGEVGEYLSGKTIEKYTGEKPQNNQEILKVKLEEALIHGVSTIEKAKDQFGEDYVSKTLNHLKSESISPEAKALTYISLENELVKQIKNNDGDNLTIQKQLDLVREKRQAFARSNSLALNMNRLQKFGEIGFDVNAVTDKLFSEKQKEAKSVIEENIQHKPDDINKQEDLEQSENVSTELKDLIQEGIDKQINEIYKRLPTSRRIKADKAIKVLENIQKDLRSKTYDASIGVPIALIDGGITIIKNAIKAGVNVADAIELGIDHIKDKFGKDWEKEKDFRKDMIDGFKSKNIDLKDKTKAEDSAKEIVKQSLIEAGYYREVTFNGEKVKRLDWVKLAGEEGSVENIKNKVEEVLTKNDKFSKKEITEMQQEFKDEYARLGAEIIQKGLNELEKRNLIKPSPNRKSEAKRLSELYNFGLLEKNANEYDNLLNKTLGLSQFEQNVFDEIKAKIKALADTFNTENNGKKLTENSIQTVANDLNHQIKELLNAVSYKEGDFKYKLITVLTDYAGLSQKALLGGLPNLIENVTSGRFAGLEQKLYTDSVITPELRKQIKNDRKIIYDDITKNAGLYYGDTNTSLVSSSRFEDWVNGKTDNRMTHAVISAITLRSWLDGADSRAKVTLSSKLFIKNAVDILSSESNPNGAMSKEDAVKFVSESLTGDSFKKALETSKSIIDKVNSKQETKQLKDTPEAIHRFAMNLVKENLMQDNRMTMEQIDVAFKSGYKSAGRDIGHEANNPISKGVNMLNASINGELEKAVSEKRYGEATALSAKMLVMRTIVNPFVGGGTNWVILGLEKSGNPLGYISTIFNATKKQELDLGTVSGIKNMSEALYRKNNYQASLTRNIIGTGVALALFAGMNVDIDDEEDAKDKLNKWLEENKWAKRYFEKLSPEALVFMISLENKELGKHLAKNLGINGDTFNNTSKLLKSLDKEGGSTSGKAGQVIGSPLNSPLAWKTVKDIQNVIRGLEGKEQITTDYKATGFWNGYFQGGLTDFLGMRPDSKNTTSSSSSGVKISKKKFKKYKKF